ncbi:hypothetical protein ACOME3_010194 [Neoechinorhynchus agilis]
MKSSSAQLVDEQQRISTECKNFKAKFDSLRKHQLIENEAVAADVKFLVSLGKPISFHKCVDGHLIVPKEKDEVLSNVQNRINFIKSEIRMLTTSSAVVSDKLEGIAEKLKRMEIELATKAQESSMGRL